MGLACIALESNPVFPTYPDRIANADVTAGLVLPNAAVAMLGKGGAAATLLLIFMGVYIMNNSYGVSVKRKAPRSLLRSSFFALKWFYAKSTAAVTSASSAEYIAVSSIFTYDIYQTYINPKASGKTLIFMSHTSVVMYAILLAGFSTGLYYIGISMGYLYLLMVTKHSFTFYRIGSR